MELMRQTANHFGAPSVLPKSLQDDELRKANEKRALVLKAIENPLDAHVKSVRNTVPDAYDLPPQVRILAERLLEDKALDQLTGNLLPDVPDLCERINIALRLNAGYLDAAKMIAERTRAEINSATTRQRDIGLVEDRAANDPIYAAAVEAAPHYKHRVKEQPIFRDGIPEGSIVLRDWED
jgi:hypothetical protein